MSKATLITNNIGRQLWAFEQDSFYMQRLRGGPYQKQNLIRLRDLVPNPNVVIDVGMNIGMNTIEYGTFAQVVHGFEPAPRTYELAEANVALNQAQYDSSKHWYGDASLKVTADLHLHNVALGAETGNVEMHLKRSDGHNRVNNYDFPSVSGRPRRKNENAVTVQVPQYTLDSYEFTNVDIIKIDVEGYELVVLEGAKETIERERPIVQVETVAGQAERYGRRLQDLLDYFTDRDYAITAASGEVLPATWEYRKRQMDRFMVPKERSNDKTRNET